MARPALGRRGGEAQARGESLQLAQPEEDVRPGPFARQRLDQHSQRGAAPRPRPFVARVEIERRKSGVDGGGEELLVLREATAVRWRHRRRGVLGRRDDPPRAQRQRQLNTREVDQPLAAVSGLGHRFIGRGKKNKRKRTFSWLAKASSTRNSSLGLIAAGAHSCARCRRNCSRPCRPSSRSMDSHALSSALCSSSGSACTISALNTSDAASWMPCFVWLEYHWNKLRNEAPAVTASTTSAPETQVACC